VLVPVIESGSDGTWIEEIDVNTGLRKRLVKSDTAQPSPDGTLIAYLANQSGKNQIWVISRDGSSPRQLTNEPDGVSNYFSWSPDATRIAYYRQPSDSRAPAAGTDRQPEASSAIIYNHDSRARPSESSVTEICSVDVHTGAESRIASTQCKPMSNPVWSPDNRSILCTLFFQNDRVHVNHFECTSFSVLTGESHPLMDGSIADSLAGPLSPDGRHIALAYSDYHGGYNHNWQIAIASSDGTGPRRFTVPFKTYPLGWSADGKRLFITRKAGVEQQILTMDLDGHVKGSIIPIEGSTITGIYPTVSRDGRLAWVESDWQGHALLRTASEGETKPHTVVSLLTTLDSCDLGVAEVTHWTSRDGVKGSGVVIKPVGYVAGKRYPLLVDLHGGPASGVGPYGLFCMNPLEWQMWAAKGYVVLAPEYRGSGNYGFDYVLKIRQSGKMFDGDFADIMAGVDHLITTGVADPARMAVVGHSWGSVETNWVITHTHRFRAAVSYEGYSDFTDIYEGAGRPNHMIEWEMNGTPSSALQTYLYNSAMYRAGDVTTPTLFINGDEGINSRSQASMYVAMTDKGIDAQLLVYKGESHVVSKPVNQRDLLYWCINWIDTHLGFPPTPDPKGVFDVTDLVTTSKQEAKR
jgi:dipeptidyl aminopeptidase/acylaminoacyl peptidase